MSPMMARALVASPRMPGSPLVDQRVVVTGGAGFLGRCVVAASPSGRRRRRPPQRGLRPHQPGAAEQLLADHQPSTVIHLAARVGGIGYNQAEPAPLYLANLLMGTHVIEAARHAAVVERTVLLGTVCSYPKFTPVPFREDSLWDGYPEETNAPVRVGQEGAPRARPGQRRAVRAALRLPHPNQPVRARRQVPSGRVARHSGADQEVRRGGRARRDQGRGVGHGPRQSRVPVRRRRRRGNRARRRARRRPRQATSSRSTSAPIAR